jgi:hypothetical protein
MGMIDFKNYLDKFQQIADKLDAKLLKKNNMEVATGIVLNSVFLKLYKKSWTNSFLDPLNAESRIFFSIWVNDAAVKQQKVFYNIHALKLRKLKGYSIQSRKFAEIFRQHFAEFSYQWQNVSLDFGPLTLMEGWVKLDSINFQNSILELANNFLQMEYLIDDTLAKFKD